MEFYFLSKKINQKIFQIFDIFLIKNTQTNITLILKKKKKKFFIFLEITKVFLSLSILIKQPILNTKIKVKNTYHSLY